MQCDVFRSKMNGNQGQVSVPLVKFKSKNSPILPLQKQIIAGINIKHSNAFMCLLVEEPPSKPW